MTYLTLVFINILKNIQNEEDYNELINLLKEICSNDDIIFHLVSNQDEINLEKKDTYFHLFYSLNCEDLKEYLQSLKEVYVIPTVYFVDELDYLAEIANILKGNSNDNILSFYKTSFHKKNNPNL